MKEENKVRNELVASKIKEIHMKVKSEGMVSVVSKIHTKIKAEMENNSTRGTADLQTICDH